MKDSDVIKRLKRIDQLNEMVHDLIHEIGDSEHPRAFEIMEDLLDQCWSAGGAQSICLEHLTPKCWAQRKLPGITFYGDIVSIRYAKAKGIDVWAYPEKEDDAIYNKERAS